MFLCGKSHTFDPKPWHFRPENIIVSSRRQQGFVTKAVYFHHDNTISPSRESEIFIAKAFLENIEKIISINNQYFKFLKPSQLGYTDIDTFFQKNTPIFVLNNPLLIYDNFIILLKRKYTCNLHQTEQQKHRNFIFEQNFTLIITIQKKAYLCSNKISQTIHINFLL